MQESQAKKVAVLPAVCIVALLLEDEFTGDLILIFLKVV